MKNQAQFLYPKVLFSQSTDNNLVVTLEAPPMKATTKRRPLCLIATIDVSGSMLGQKLDYAKKTVNKLIDHLMPGDFFGINTFGSYTTTIAAPAEMTQERKEALKIQVNKIITGGGTNLSGGLIASMEAANKLDLPSEYITRVILLTDGQANEGIATTHEAIVALAKANRGHCSVSGFGYGEGCDHEMLGDLAKTSDGNYAFIANPDDALSAFGKELGGLASVYAQDLVIDISPIGDHEIVEVVSDVDVDQKDKAVQVKLSDILAEEKRNIVLNMKLAEQKKPGPREVNVADVTLSYKSMEDGKLIPHTVEFKAKVQFCKDGEETKADGVDKALVNIVGLAALAQAQVKAEEHAKAGRYGQASDVLGAQLAAFQVNGLTSNLATAAADLRTKYATQNAYATSAGYRTSSKGMITRGMTVSSTSADVNQLYSVALCDTGSTVSNSTQGATVSSFVDSPSESINLVIDTDYAAQIAKTVVPDVAAHKPPAARANKSKSKTKW